MGLFDGIARRFGYKHASEIERQLKDELAKQGNVPQLGYGIFQNSIAGKIGFSPLVESRIGPNKAVLTEFWVNPLYGQPRLVDLRTVKQLARHGVGSMAIDKILDIIAQEKWAILPKKGSERNEQHIDQVTEFLEHPNRNNESFDAILRKVIKGILETDDGTIVKVFDKYEEVPAYSFGNAGTYETVPQENAMGTYGYPRDTIPAKDAQLIELFAEDGSSFLKATDMHQYLLRYWQYSFIIPRKPISFAPREICYFMQGPRSGSPYGTSPFESCVDWLTYLIKASKYNERFYENSSYPSFQIDFPNVKTQNDIEAWAEWYRKNYMGVEKSFQALVTNGGATINPLTFDNKALQNLESQQWYLQLILTKLKFPYQLFLSDANRAQSGQLWAAFRAQGIKPLEDIVENEINRQIINELDPDGCCEFKFVSIADLDEEERRATINATYIQNSLKTINEIRETMDLEPIDGGDETVTQRNERMMREKVKMDNTENQQQQNRQAETAAKRPPTESQSYSGNKQPTKVPEIPYPAQKPEIEDIPKQKEREYVGMCSECVEAIYSDTKDIHKDHMMMKGGKMTKAFTTTLDYVEDYVDFKKKKQEEELKVLTKKKEQLEDIDDILSKTKGKKKK